MKNYVLILGPKHKSAIWDRTPPHLHIKSSLYVWRRAHGSQIFNWNLIIFNSFMFYSIFKILDFFGSRGAGQVGGWWYLG